MKEGRKKASWSKAREGCNERFEIKVSLKIYKKATTVLLNGKLTIFILIQRSLVLKLLIFLFACLLSF